MSSNRGSVNASPVLTNDDDASSRGSTPMQRSVSFIADPLLDTPTAALGGGGGGSRQKNSPNNNSQSPSSSRVSQQQRGDSSNKNHTNSSGGDGGDQQDAQSTSLKRLPLFGHPSPTKAGTLGALLFQQQHSSREGVSSTIAAAGGGAVIVEGEQPGANHTNTSPPRGVSSGGSSSFQPQVSFRVDNDNHGDDDGGHKTPLIAVTSHDEGEEEEEECRNNDDPIETSVTDRYKNGYHTTRSDLLALATLQKEMINSTDAREDLKSRIEEAAWLVMNHHSNHALDNVTLARNVETLAEEIQEKETAVKNLETDVKYAVEEQRRLQDLNDALLQGVREKAAEKERVIAKLQTFAECEKRIVKSTINIQLSIGKIEHDEAQLALGTKEYTGKTGSHHADLMLLEQTQLDLTLEAESLKKRILQLTGAPPEAKEGWERPNYEHLFHPCANAECGRTRRQVRDVKSRVELLQHHVGKRRSSVTSSSVASKPISSVRSRGGAY